jgi:hypothetical protein
LLHSSQNIVIIKPNGAGGMKAILAAAIFAAANLFLMKPEIRYER